MKLILLLLTLTAFSIIGYCQKSNLTPSETSLLKKLNFRSDLISEVKDLTKKELKQLPAIEEETGDVERNKFDNGVYSVIEENKAIELVKKLKSKFRQNGYLIFVYEGEDNNKSVAVIKGTNDLDILKYRRTDGINHGLENKDVVKKISDWKSKYGLVVIGCGRDWLQVEFDKLPSDLNAFAKEVYKFCPDSVDQGVGTVDKLRDAIKEMNGIWLWWD